MPILYHAPMTRSTGAVALVHELGVDEITIQDVTIARPNGIGGPDPQNPHPEKKVPYLVDGDEHLRERAAIFAYLTDKYPDAGLAPLPGQPGRGAYLSWLAYYQGVIETVLIVKFSGLDAGAIAESVRDVDTMMATLEAALQKRPWLLGDTFSAADILCSSPFFWFDGLTEGYPNLTDWVQRCGARPGMQYATQRDATAMSA
ncbi:glutathione S-transferase family protein [Pseudooceanicola sp. MF1-13]|uniref:glutathione S-transferase family protein n=1 Tax=Pseudooceanicola sp. MF1-13 TaxID=3379095 RepID=UPI003891F65C